MTADSAEFQDLMRGVFAGQPAARERFCRHYQSHIQRVVRRRLLRPLRPKFDSLDFVNDVWASFFARPPRHVRFDSPEAVAAYLEQMTRHKVGEAVRQRTQTIKYNVYRERPLPEPAAGSFGIPLAARQPSPSQLVGAEEEYQRLRRDRPPQQQQILDLLRAGLTHREIASKLHTNEKTIQRLVRRLDPESNP